MSNADLNPAAARLVTIEAMAGGPPVRTEHEKLLVAIEESIERYLDDDSGDGPRLEIPARALLGGVGSVMAIRAFRGETGRLIELLDDLLAWVDSYAAPSDRPRLSGAEWEELGAGLATLIEGSSEEDPPDSRLPRGRSALPAGVVASEHRERILTAVARLAREKGYAAMTVADVVSTAAVTRESFYELFRNKEDAFLATQAMGLQESVSRAAGAFFAGATWPDRVWDGLEAMLSYVAMQPDLICVDIIESYAVGPAAIRRSFDNRMAYTLFLEDGYRQRPEAERLPHLCSEAIGGAILELLRCQVVAGRTERMLEILPQAVYVALAPFIGPAEALELVRKRCRTPSERSPAPPAAG